MHMYICTCICIYIRLYIHTHICIYTKQYRERERTCKGGKERAGGGAYNHLIHVHTQNINMVPSMPYRCISFLDYLVLFICFYLSLT